MKSKFILYNQEFFTEDEKLFDYKKLSSQLFSEKIRVIRSQFPFWEEHIQLIIFKLKLRNLNTPTFLQNDGRDLKRQIERSLTKNKLFKSAIVSLIFFEQNKEISYIISVEKIAATNFDLNKEDLIVEIYDKAPKSISPLSSLSEGSEPFWKIMQAKRYGTEPLLVNTSNNIIEAAEKNIFLIKDNLICTPELSTGAYIDISRKFIETAVKNLGLEFIETNQIKETDLLEADEVFLCNGIAGIEWIKGFKNKRYFCKTIRLINEEFNKLLVK